MAFNANSIAVLSLFLCFVIVLLAYVNFRKNKNKAAINIGIAFGLFGVIHLMSILQLGTNYAAFLIAARILAYLLVILSLYKSIK